MTPRRHLRSIALFTTAAALTLPGCFTIEHHIFLNADGTGRFLWHLAVASPKTAATDSAKKDEPSPKDKLGSLKEDLMKLKGSGLTQIDVKELDRRDLGQLQASMTFASIEGLAKAMTALTMPEKKGEKEEQMVAWAARLTPKDGKRILTSSYALTVDLSEGGKEQDEMTKQIATIMLAMASVHFTVHTPTPILSHNADFAEGTRASWRAALSSFAESGPMQMELAF